MTGSLGKSRGTAVSTRAGRERVRSGRWRSAAAPPARSALGAVPHPSTNPPVRGSYNTPAVTPAHACLIVCESPHHKMVLGGTAEPPRAGPAALDEM